ECLSADQARDPGPGDEAEHQNEVGQGWAYHGGDDEGQDQPRHRDEQIDELYEDPVEPSPGVARGESDRHTYQSGDGGGADADQQRWPPAIEHAAQHVAAELVGSEQVL